LDGDEDLDASGEEPAECGNGDVEPGEECDDGNHDNTDACPDGEGGTCLDAFCGDGHVREGVEECDDGNATSGDGCSSGCVVECTRGPNVAPSATPTSSGGGTGDWGVDQMTNGELEDTCHFHWVAAGHVPGDAFIQLEWSSARTLFGMSIDTNQWENTTCYLPGGATLAGGSVEWWDGGAWLLAGAVSGKPDDWTFEFDPEVTTTRVRVYGVHATDLGGDTRNPIVYEWEVYECRW
jgi:cysteine-rich repeat protein